MGSGRNVSIRLVEAGDAEVLSALEIDNREYLLGGGRCAPMSTSVSQASES